MSDFCKIFKKTFKCGNFPVSCPVLVMSFIGSIENKIIYIRDGNFFKFFRRKIRYFHIFRVEVRICMRCKDIFQEKPCIEIIFLNRAFGQHFYNTQVNEVFVYKFRIFRVIVISHIFSLFKTVNLRLLGLVPSFTSLCCVHFRHKGANFLLFTEKPEIFLRLFV